MTKKLFAFTFLLLFITTICSILYGASGNTTYLSFAVSFGTTAYHFIMRLFVGLTFGKVLKLSPSSWWFREKFFEKKLYKILQVKKWKDKLPTYNPATFNIKTRSFADIINATCYSEILHELMALLSFAPLLLIIPFGSVTVFVVTSTIGAAFDMLFVIIQRYNRPRLLKCLRG